MNWLKLFFVGVLVWSVPFLLTELLFPQLPETADFVINLLVAAIALGMFSSHISIGYLRKRIKINVGTGFLIGLVWFSIAFTGSGIYYIAVRDQMLLDFLINQAPLYLIYLILAVFYGYCEERRGRRR